MAADSVQISPDGGRVVFVRSVPGDLVSVPIDDGTLKVKINDFGSVLPAFTQISADSGRVVYVADQDTQDVFELYSRPLDGSGPSVKLSGPLVSGGRIRTLKVADSHVVYIADQDTMGATELFSVPIDGSAPAVKLNGALASGGDVFEFEGQWNISPDNRRVVYTADQDANGKMELYGVAVDGSDTFVKLNGELVSGGNVLTRAWQFSPDSRHVLYLADQDTNSFFELFSVPVDGKTPAVKLNDAQVDRVYSASVPISPDSSRVIYKGERRGATIFSVAIDGSTAPIVLHDPFDPDGEYARSTHFTPDGLSVVYVLNRFPPSAHNRRWSVNVVPVDGGTPLELHEIFAPAPGFSFFDLRISPDGTHAVYQMPDIPTPTTTMVLTWGGAALLCRRRRKRVGSKRGRLAAYAAKTAGELGALS